MEGNKLNPRKKKIKLKVTRSFYQLPSPQEKKKEQRKKKKKNLGEILKYFKSLFFFFFLIPTFVIFNIIENFTFIFKTNYDEMKITFKSV